MSVVVPMVMVSKRRHAHQINQQSQRADDKQLRQPLRLVALDDALKGLEHDLDADEHQEDAVGEARQGLDLAEAVGEALAGRPLARHGGEEAHRQCHAVEEHVDAVREQAEGVGYVAVEGLDGHEGEVETGWAEMPAVSGFVSVGMV